MAIFDFSDENKIRYPVKAKGYRDGDIPLRDHAVWGNDYMTETALPSYFRYWGKADSNRSGESKWHLLAYHCLDVAAVGHVLLEKDLNILKRFVGITAAEETICRYWILLFLGLHDIGKFSEGFQNLRPDLLEKLQAKKSRQPYSVRHDSLGHLLWGDSLWHSFKIGLFSCHPEYKEYSDYWQEIFSCIARAHTGHHGEPPRITGPNNLRLNLSISFGDNDIKAAADFLKDLNDFLFREQAANFQLPSPMNIYGTMPIASWLMAGFAVLCDWIGSNTQWFPFCQKPMPLAEYWQSHALPQAQRAIQDTGIMAAKSRKYTDHFSDLFPAIEEPTPLQSFVLDCPIEETPQLFILEDVTGSGKTEAAILLTHRMMAGGLGKGVFIALPTMATSNAMYERVSKVYRKLFTEESTPSIILSHGKRHLSEPFLRSIASPCEIPEGYGKEDEAASAQCASWLADNRKKALLADVGVGTIDQALLAVLPSRFQSLRLFGLAGHILVVDEVHAYDPYMNKLLQNLLYFHAALGGSAILLSATLPMQVRRELIASFSRGLSLSPVPQVDCNNYPLVTKLSCDSGLVETTIAAASQRKTRINVEIVSEQDEVQRRIVMASSQGKCVCWIRNTVHDALTGYESLQPLIGQDRIMLFHARFAMGDRLNIENGVLKSFGYHSTAEDRQGKVLIATQVVEQSLDLDFDLLISDLAPMDLLIQRAGRLHRHLRDKRGNLLPQGAGADQRERPCLIIHGPLPEKDSGDDWYKTAFPKAAFVYPSHGRLWLTMQILREKGELCTPDDARELIEAAYSEAADQMIPTSLHNRDIKADAQWQADKSLAHINMLTLKQGYEATWNQWLEDMRTPTRLGAIETTVRLARWDGVKLSPWSVDGDFPWDMSQVSIRSSVIYSEAVCRDPALQSSIEKLKEALPDKGKWSVLIPLFCDTDGIWRGEALDKKGSTVVITCNSSIGITVTKKEE